MTSEPESINNYVSVSATQCLPPSSFPPPKNGSQIISPPDLACGSFLSDNHVETIDFKNETPPELSIIGTIHNESNKQVEFALNEDRNVCDYESSPGTSPVDNHIMQYPVNIQFNETNHNQKNSPQEQKINENLPHSDKTSSIINETTTNIKNSNNNSGNNSNNNGKGCTQDNEKINGEGNQAHDHLSDSPLLDPIYSNDISTQEINNIEDAKILDEMRYNIGIDSIDFSDVSNQILQGVKFNPFILRYPSLFIEAPNIINENDKNGQRFIFL
ncbi:hypothetical protein TRFO_23032 [Tritrichomonas foetus]|uniref:Uncharacterized protein n=1 Tax=Tritrichomonas foetus TaxID=1144522 RepID=A0A1J4KGI1_9EUKA|nr:hypothetical protein TRFO_23032 [Tritrichomonas foetus]|eukprot:OHT08437.1 hypothetical protein TRFO_23032 [Tritrichomonas foetus]